MKNDAAESIADSATVLSDMSMSFVKVETAPPDTAPALSFSVAPKNEVIGQDSQISKLTACVTMKAIELAEDDSRRASIDLIVVLDVSGSMYGSKLALCKTTLELLLRVLYPGDRFGLICYSDNATIECPTQKMSESNKQKCRQKIRSLGTRGCTNISSAIGLAHQEIHAIENPNEVRSVFLLTDGHANTGISDKAGLVEVTKNCFATEKLDNQNVGMEEYSTDDEESKPKAVIVKNDCPITLHCFGYGPDHNSSLLEEMCGVTPGGSYYFMEDDTNVGAAFGDALGGILSVVAQNVSVTIDVPADAKEKGAKIVEVWNDRKVKRENGSYNILVGDFYAEETRDLLFDVNLVKGDTLPSHPTPIPHATISVSYIDTIQKIPVTTESILCEITRPIGSEVSESNEYVEAEFLRVGAINVMDEADKLASQGNIAQAKGKLQELRAHIQSSKNKTDMLDQLSSDLCTLEEGFATVSSYRARGSKHKSNMSVAYKTQRCMDSGGLRSKSNVYQNKKKKSVMEKFLGVSKKGSK